MIRCPPLEAAPVGSAQRVRMTLGLSDLKSYADLIFFPSTTMPFTSYLSCCGVRKMSLAPEGEAKG